MDLKAIKDRLSSLNTGGKTKKEKKDYTLLYWKPREEGKYQIRFVPSKLNPQNPFQEAYFHYGISKFPIPALTNWNEKDPIVDFVKKLKESGDPSHWETSKTLSPKMRVFAPVIVRGEEEKGVRLFEFSRTVYMDLLAIADDEDYGDFTDVKQGFDFTINASKVAGRPGFNIGLTPKPKQTPLSKDAGEIAKWLDEQPILLDEVYKYTYDKLKEELQKYLTEDEGEEEVDTVEEAEIVKPIKPTIKPQSTATPKKSTVNKFADTFEEEEEEEEAGNDLPW
jgi:hypothetical protein